MLRFLLISPLLLCTTSAWAVQSEPAPFNPSKEKVGVMRTSVRIINAIIDRKLGEEKLTYNSALNDFLFARRIYVDLTGTIPTYEELVHFANDKRANKRTYLVNRLLASEGYVSHTFNYFADLLRIQTKMNGSKSTSENFTGWLKDSIHQDKPYNRLVYEMISSTGSMQENPATGYHLRDKDMKLDHVAFMTKAFLAKDIACAQCHDHPSDDWTQKQYYAFASYLGELEIGQSKVLSKQKDRKMMYAEKEKFFYHPRFGSAVKRKYGNNPLAQKKIKDFRQEFKNFTAGNTLAVFDDKTSSLTLPDDYQYEDAKAGDQVKPSFIVGKSLGGPKNVPLRKQLAYWLAHPENGWFSLAIANRTWARYLGKGVAEPLHNVEIKKASNPLLLKTLSEVMVALDFDLRAFSWVVVHTKAYNSLASRIQVKEGKPFHFPGPTLRRMSAEQIWDSLVTLMVKDPLRYRQPGPPSLLDVYNGQSALDFIDRKDDGKYRLIDSETGNEVLIDGSDQTLSQSQQRISVSSGKGKKETNLILARASELPQPAPSGHLLRKFGQSERLFVVGASSRVGSVPQLMELMNGFPTEVLTSRDSLLFRKVRSVSDPRKQAEVVFLSILNRLPTESEKKLLLDQTGSSEGDLSDLIWALLNTPEFFFIK
jgi:hypothetical protein